MQALSKDKLYPGIGFFAKGHGKDNSPIRGYILCFFVAIGWTLIGTTYNNLIRYYNVKIMLSSFRRDFVIAYEYVFHFPTLYIHERRTECDRFAFGEFLHGLLWHGEFLRVPRQHQPLPRVETGFQGYHPFLIRSPGYAGLRREEV